MLVSVIVPVFNGRQHLARSLSAIRRSSYPDLELIVVDDNSSDDSPLIAKKFTDTVLELKERRAPGFARNFGARQAKGDIFFFVDADVEIKPDTVARVAEEMKKDPDVVAVFGSYDDSPLEKDFFSQYKNLFHHFVHQGANADAKTFWAGCGAVRRDAFLKAGGFAEDYSTASIEDVVLGYRLIELGHKIRLLKHLQVKHLKKWTLGTLIKTDIFHRAIPWSRLASSKGLPKDLNFKFVDRLSAVAAWGLLVALCLSVFVPTAGAAAIFIGLLLGLNRRLYTFFLRKKGLRFTLPAVLFHWFYLLYSSFIFGLFAFMRT